MDIEGDVTEPSPFRTNPKVILTPDRQYHEWTMTRFLLQSEPEALKAYEYLADEIIRTDKGDTGAEVWKDHLLKVLLDPSHPSHWWVKAQPGIFLAAPDQSVVREKLATIFRQTKRKLADPFEAAAYLHMELAKLHPFDDGNGGTARLFVVGILTGAGYLPPIMWSNKEYMAAVNESIKQKDIGIFADYLKKMVCLTESIMADEKKQALFEKLRTLIQDSSEQCVENLSGGYGFIDELLDYRTITRKIDRYSITHWMGHYAKLCIRLYKTFVLGRKYTKEDFCSETLQKRCDLYLRELELPVEALAQTSSIKTEL